MSSSDQFKLSDFHFDLPQSAIAVEPLADRVSARLLCLGRFDGTMAEKQVTDFAGLLQPEDLLVLNDTRVIPARLFGQKESGGKVEIFLVRKVDSLIERWLVLIRSSKAPKTGSLIHLSENVIARIVERAADGHTVVDFSGSSDFDAWLEKWGAVPLPPYIKRDAAESDRERYQTVFAREKGAVAAPTAGLHFTRELLDTISAKGVAMATVTLHVGLGTFMPVRVENPADHKMHSERFVIPEETAYAVKQCRERGGRVVAVGTTVARTLEYSSSNNLVKPGSGEADIFIYPGYSFNVVDALLTNFHLPESTLLMLVSAFAGRENILAAYQHAIDNGFRFYSYGDAMFIA